MIKKNIKRRKVKSEHYINNDRFQECIKLYYTSKNQNEKDILWEELGDTLYKLSSTFCKIQMGKNSNDDMVQDGVLKCVRYFDRYDFKKYNNPFSYFTSIIRGAIWDHINSNRKFLCTRYVCAASILDSPDKSINQQSYKQLLNETQKDIMKNQLSGFLEWDEIKRRKTKIRNEIKKLEANKNSAFFKDEIKVMLDDLLEELEFLKDGK